MVTLMLVTGIIIVIAVIYLLIKGYDAKVVLIGAGILMAIIGGAPMAPLDAFAKRLQAKMTERHGISGIVQEL